MKTNLRREGNRQYIEVTYDPSTTLTWQEAIAAATASYGIRPDQLTVVVLHPILGNGNINAAHVTRTE